MIVTKTLLKAITILFIANCIVYGQESRPTSDFTLSSNYDLSTISPQQIQRIFKIKPNDSEEWLANLASVMKAYQNTTPDPNATLSELEDALKKSQPQIDLLVQSLNAGGKADALETNILKVARPGDYFAWQKKKDWKYGNIYQHMALINYMVKRASELDKTDKEKAASYARATFMMDSYLELPVSQGLLENKEFVKAMHIDDAQLSSIQAWQKNRSEYDKNYGMHEYNTGKALLDFEEGQDATEKYNNVLRKIDDLRSLALEPSLQFRVVDCLHDVLGIAYDHHNKTAEDLIIKYASTWKNEVDKDSLLYMWIAEVIDMPKKEIVK